MVLVTFSSVVKSLITVNESSESLYNDNLSNQGKLRKRVRRERRGLSKHLQYIGS